MYLSPALQKEYTKDNLSAKDAQRLAEFIAWGPEVFQVTRLMMKFGILEMLRDSNEGMTREEISQKTGLSDYAVKILTEASLSIGTIIIDEKTNKFSLTKVGFFLVFDKATIANMNFNHDVNYVGLFNLEEALKEGKPCGLKHFGDWPTVYEALSVLPKNVQDSWFGFDHFYSDHSFPEALKIVFDYKPSNILDVGGNTGRWALQCVKYNPDVNVTILDLPQQINMMRENVKEEMGSERIFGYGMDLLNKDNAFPTDKHYDIIWMSQFLDCFSGEEITSILYRASKIMDDNSRIFIMETLWDRQKYETSAMCLTLTSVYFTDIANGNSKMYNTEDMTSYIENAGLKVEKIYDNLGQGHSILVCKKV